MKKDQECPNCGSASPIITGSGEYKCSHCNTIFFNVAMVQQNTLQSAKRIGLRFVIVFATIVFLIFSFVAFVLFKTIVNPDNAKQEINNGSRQVTTETRATNQ